MILVWCVPLWYLMFTCVYILVCPLFSGIWWRLTPFCVGCIEWGKVLLNSIPFWSDHLGDVNFGRFMNIWNSACPMNTWIFRSMLLRCLEIFITNSFYCNTKYDKSAVLFFQIAFHPKFSSSRVEKERRAILSELQMMNTIEYRVDCQASELFTPT
jgi:hypothetical protein